MPAAGTRQGGVGTGASTHWLACWLVSYPRGGQARRNSCVTMTNRNTLQTDAILSCSSESRHEVKGVAMFAKISFTLVSCNGHPWFCLTAPELHQHVMWGNSASLDGCGLGASSSG